MNGLIVFIALAFLVAGAGYGIGAKTMKGSADVIKAMEKAVTGLGGLLLLLFFNSQFIALFTYTNLGTIAAAKLGDGLERAGLGPLPLLVGFALVAAVLNLVITGIIPKWAVFAPVFVPLF
jgi:aminobenzoyl-glutamate transport protein